ncbi:tetratricopeptide repeat protein [Clostridium novyi]|uniref:Conserved protein, putative n=1 Tax=Clostridium novyi (strain NT) TaxID=386415 RepID=A0PYT3_CLONN|nr:tetratricopeptide repeat protein [Clostridium novyi]ABK61356.1 conserved protein, putative [Clostridium novyi NT]KEH86775.1 hypothetical protein Z966_01845 [Clostridium novyi A str. NCTC 538]
MEKVIELAAVYYNTALKLISENKISKAITNIKKSLKLYSKDCDVLNLMGLCNYTLCEFDKAYFYWSKSLEYKKHNNKAELYLNLLKSRKFNRFIKEYNEGIEFLYRYEYKKAIEKFKEIITEENELLEPYIIIGLCYYAIGKYNIAKKYMEMALNIDNENRKCLMYLNEINNKRNVTIVKYKSSKVAKTVASVSTILLIASSVLYYKNYKGYINIKDTLAEYEHKYKINNTELQLIRGKYNKLSNSINMEKGQIQNKFQGKNDSEVFNDGILNYKKKDYKKAIENFSYLMDRGIDSSIVAEATFFSAVTYEKLNNIGKSEELYYKYIDKYKGKNYYDDSLYNCGIMLYRSGNKEKAKKVLSILQKEVPDSMFVNKTVKMILNN